MPPADARPATAGLLVSVRGADEARAALAGGAAVIDVKEPDRGPLGRADLDVWRAIRAVVPPSIPLSVALGELEEWEPKPDGLGDDPWPALDFCKLGLAGMGGSPGWERAWADRANGSAPARAGWRSSMPTGRSPGRPTRKPCSTPRCAVGCAGVLVDTYEKDGPSPLDAGPLWCAGPIARDAGLFVALAGGLDADDFARLAPLGPDLFGVRGAACGDGVRGGTIDAGRVARLVAAAGRISRRAGGGPAPGRAGTPSA